MKNPIALLCILCTFSGVSQFSYEPSATFPFGRANPEAPMQIKDFEPMIGECNCVSVTRKADQNWAEPVPMVWRFKYIMNGMAIQDETLKEDGTFSGSIRQFVPDSTRWYVHYYNTSAPSNVLPAWEGNRTANGDIILYREQKAPNNTDGYYKITFSEISAEGFKWLGEWVSEDESFHYPTWKIDCKKAAFNDNSGQLAEIEAEIKEFSRAYMEGDYDALANAYTPDGKIFPNNTGIIEGREAIKARWTLPEGARILKHEVNPESISIIGNYAHDYGYYEGMSSDAGGEISNWKGKYVIIWKKIEGDWKIYLDIWNRVPM